MDGDQLGGMDIIIGGDVQPAVAALDSVVDALNSAGAKFDAWAKQVDAAGSSALTSMGRTAAGVASSLLSVEQKLAQAEATSSTRLGALARKYDDLTAKRIRDAKTAQEATAAYNARALAAEDRYLKERQSLLAAANKRALLAAEQVRLANARTPPPSPDNEARYGRAGFRTQEQDALLTSDTEKWQAARAAALREAQGVEAGILAQGNLKVLEAEQSKQNELLTLQQEYNATSERLAAEHAAKMDALAAAAFRHGQATLPAAAAREERQARKEKLTGIATGAGDEGERAAALSELAALERIDRREEAEADRHNEALAKQDAKRREFHLGSGFDFERAGNTLMTGGAVGAAVLAAGAASGADFDTQWLKAVNNTTLNSKEKLDVRGNVRSMIDEGTNQPVEQLFTAAMRAANFRKDGQSIAQTMDIMRVGVKAATAQFADAGKTTEMLAREMHIFRIPVGDASATMNLLIEAARQSNQTLEEFQSSFGRVAEDSAVLGASLADTAAVYALLTKNGNTSAQSATATRAIFKGMVEPTKQVRAEIEALAKAGGPDLSVYFGRQNLAVNNLVGNLQGISKAVGGNKDQLLKLFPDMRSSTKALYLMTDGSKDLVTQLNGEKKAFADNRIWQENYAKVTQTATFQAAALWQKVMNLGNTFENQLLPALKDVIGAGNTFIKWFEDLSPEQKSVVVDTLAWGTALGLAGGALFKVIGFVAEMITVGNRLQALLGTLILRFGGVGTAAGAATTEVAAVGTAATTAAEVGAAAFAVGAPWALAIGAAILLVGGLVKAFRDASKAQDDFAAKRVHDAKFVDTGDFRSNSSNEATLENAEADRQQGLLDQMNANGRAMFHPRNRAIGIAEDKVEVVTGSIKPGMIENNRNKYVAMLTANIAALRASAQAHQRVAAGTSDFADTQANLRQQIAKSVASEKAIQDELNRKVQRYGPAQAARQSALQADLRSLQAGRAANEKALATISPSQFGGRAVPMGGGESREYGGVKQWVAVSGDEMRKMFGFRDIGGRASSGHEPNSDHYTGTALDYMIHGDTAKGAALAAYMQAHAKEQNVKYVIWQQHIWNPSRAGEGWRLMKDRGSPTANHMDHVHVSYLMNPTGSPVTTAGNVVGGDFDRGKSHLADWGKGQKTHLPSERSPIPLAELDPRLADIPGSGPRPNDHALAMHRATLAAYKSNPNLGKDQQAAIDAVEAYNLRIGGQSEEEQDTVKIAANKLRLVRAKETKAALKALQTNQAHAAASLKRQAQRATLSTRQFQQQYNALIARGDAADRAGNGVEAKKLFTQAHDLQVSHNTSKNGKADYKALEQQALRAAGAVRTLDSHLRDAQQTEDRAAKTTAALTDRIAALGREKARQEAEDGRREEARKLREQRYQDRMANMTRHLTGTHDFDDRRDNLNEWLSQQVKEQGGATDPTGDGAADWLVDAAKRGDTAGAFAGGGNTGNIMAAGAYYKKASEKIDSDQAEFGAQKTDQKMERQYQSQDLSAKAYLEYLNTRHQMLAQGDDADQAEAAEFQDKMFSVEEKGLKDRLDALKEQWEAHKNGMTDRRYVTGLGVIQGDAANHPEVLKQITGDLDAVQKKADEVARGVSTKMTDMMMGVIKKTHTMRQAIEQVFQDVKDQIMQSLLNSFFSKAVEWVLGTNNAGKLPGKGGAPAKTPEQQQADAATKQQAAADTHAKAADLYRTATDKYTAAVDKFNAGVEALGKAIEQIGQGGGAGGTGTPGNGLAADAGTAGQLGGLLGGAGGALGSIGGALSSAAPYLGAALAVGGALGLFGGGQGRPDYTTSLGAGKYNSILGQNYSGTADSGYSGTAGLRALLGNETQGQAMAPHVTVQVQEGAIQAHGVQDPQQMADKIVPLVTKKVTQAVASQALYGNIARGS